MPSTLPTWRPCSTVSPIASSSWAAGSRERWLKSSSTAPLPSTTSRSTLHDRNRQGASVPQRQAPLDKPGVRIIADDPRRFLQAEGLYDLILIGMPEPSSGQANRFYTLEFFKLCRERLKADGIVALRIQAAENRWTPQMTERALSIHGALLPSSATFSSSPGTRMW